MWRWICTAAAFSFATSAVFMLARAFSIMLVVLDSGTIVTALLLLLNCDTKLLVSFALRLPVVVALVWTLLLLLRRLEIMELPLVAVLPPVCDDEPCPYEEEPASCSSPRSVRFDGAFFGSGVDVTTVLSCMSTSVSFVAGGGAATADVVLSFDAPVSLAFCSAAFCSAGSVLAELLTVGVVAVTVFLVDVADDSIDTASSLESAIFSDTSTAVAVGMLSVAASAAGAAPVDGVVLVMASDDFSTVSAAAGTAPSSLVACASARSCLSPAGSLVSLCPSVELASPMVVVTYTDLLLESDSCDADGCTVTEIWTVATTLPRAGPEMAPTRDSSSSSLTSSCSPTTGHDRAPVEAC
uniref:Uncharacterized protein n=1 Tax=Anopheles farauti TaxID=69004 RepID=A0A182QSN7_9DIPT